MRNPTSHSFVWTGWAAEGMKGSSKYAIDSHLMIRILEIALMNEDKCQNSWDRLKCLVMQTSVTLRNVAEFLFIKELGDTYIKPLC